MAEAVLGRRDGPIHYVTINRPERRNALTPEVTRGIARQVEAAGMDDVVRAIVLRGAEGHFSVGLDLQWFLELGEEATPERIEAGLQDFQSAIREVVGSAKPVIAALEGNAAGFGVDLALAADLRIADVGATLTSAFSSIGLVPDGGSTYTLPRLVGESRAFRFLTTGETLTAAAAMAWGMVDAVAPEGRLEDLIRETAESLAKGAAGSLLAIKRLVRGNDLANLEHTLAEEGRAQLAALQGPEFRERLQAFLARKRKAPSRA
jgi:2-(1,2-epoxy-1,2-dihydrophenyl)acetyl-CoA isomerase